MKSHRNSHGSHMVPFITLVVKIFPSKWWMINTITSQNVHGFRFSDFSSNGHDLDHGFKVPLWMIKSFSSYQLLRVSPRAPPSAPSPSPTRRARFEDEDVTDLKTRWTWELSIGISRGFTSKDGGFSWGLHCTDFTFEKPSNGDFAIPENDDLAIKQRGFNLSTQSFIKW